MQSLAVIEFPAETSQTETFDMAITIATLEERVTNHIKFFWVVVGFGFVWLSVLSALIYRTNDSVNRVEKAQVDAPAKIVAKILSESETSNAATVANLNAVVTILQSSKVGQVRPDVSVLRTVSSKLSDVQGKHPDLPQVWQATGAFINYKSDVLLPASSTTLTSAKNVRCEQKLTQAGWVFSNCETTLEELAQAIQGTVVNGLPAPFTFLHCIVHYKGGAIPAKRMIFLDCVFRFQVLAVPPPEGMVAMTQLTTVGEGQIKVSIS